MFACALAAQPLRAEDLPELGDVASEELSLAAEKKIGSLLEKGGYLKKAEVNMLVTTLASQQVSVLGQVNRPGRYPVEGPRKVLDLLAMAGGVSAEGSDLISLVRTRDGKDLGAMPLEALAARLAEEVASRGRVTLEV